MPAPTAACWRDTTPRPPNAATLRGLRQRWQRRGRHRTLNLAAHDVDHETLTQALARRTADPERREQRAARNTVCFDLLLDAELDAAPAKGKRRGANGKAPRSARRGRPDDTAPDTAERHPALAREHGREDEPAPADHAGDYAGEASPGMAPATPAEQAHVISAADFASRAAQAEAHYNEHEAASDDDPTLAFDLHHSQRRIAETRTPCPTTGTVRAADRADRTIRGPGLPGIAALTQALQNVRHGTHPARRGETGPSQRHQLQLHATDAAGTPFDLIVDATPQPIATTPETEPPRGRGERIAVGEAIQGQPASRQPYLLHAHIPLMPLILACLPAGIRQDPRAMAEIMNAIAGLAPPPGVTVQASGHYAELATMPQVVASAHAAAMAIRAHIIPTLLGQAKAVATRVRTRVRLRQQRDAHDQWRRDQAQARDAHEAERRRDEDRDRQRANERRHRQWQRHQGMARW